MSWKVAFNEAHDSTPYSLINESTCSEFAVGFTSKTQAEVVATVLNRNDAMRNALIRIKEYANLHVLDGSEDLIYQLCKEVLE